MEFNRRLLDSGVSGMDWSWWTSIVLVEVFGGPFSENLWAEVRFPGRSHFKRMLYKSSGKWFHLRSCTFEFINIAGNQGCERFSVVPYLQAVALRHEISLLKSFITESNLATDVWSRARFSGLHFLCLVRVQSVSNDYENSPLEWLSPSYLVSAA